MFLNQIFMKCGNNGHCDSPSAFGEQLNVVHSFCAAQTFVDGEEIRACAASPEAATMAMDSYAASDALNAGFAPIFVAGKQVAEGALWRDSPDANVLGQNVLAAVCNASAPARKPFGCTPKKKKNCTNLQ
jgi:hypothetical protein